MWQLYCQKHVQLIVTSSSDAESLMQELDSWCATAVWTFDLHIARHHQASQQALHLKTIGSCMKLLGSARQSVVPNLA